MAVCLPARAHPDPGVYLLATRTRFFENPFNPLAPTATPTRSAVSYLADAEDAYKAGLLAKAAGSYETMLGLEPDNYRTLYQVAWLWILRGHPEKAVPARAEGRRRRAERARICRSSPWRKTGAGSTTTRSRTR